MILGSHNSLTYLPPKTKWMKFLTFFYKCQDKSLSEQIKSGVHVLDIKVRFRNNKVIVTNGQWEVKYEYEMEDFINIILDTISIYRIDDDVIYINLSLDVDDVYIGQEFDFISFVDIFKQKINQVDENIKLIGGYRTFDNERVVITIPKLFIATITNKTDKRSWWFEKYFPKLFAKRMNEKNKILWENEDCLTLFDFV